MNNQISNAAVERAIAIFGSGAALAERLEVTPAAVGQWKSGERRVPAERCLLIERATAGAVRCEELRPDVAWDVLRSQSEPGAGTADLQHVDAQEA